MNAIEAHPRTFNGDNERSLSPEQFEALRHAYHVKNKQYIPAVRSMVDEGRLDRTVLARLERVKHAHIMLAADEHEHDETENFASAYATAGELVVPDERYVSHEATHLLGEVAWRPLNEGLTQLMADRIGSELDVEEVPWLYEEEKRLAANIVRLAGIDITPGSDMEDVNWARLSRLFCGDDPEENFNELNMLVRRKTGADILAEMRDLQGRGEYMELAEQRRTNEEPDKKSWGDQNSSERLLLEAREMNAVLEVPRHHLQQKTSRPLGRTAGKAAVRHRGTRRKPGKLTRLFSR